MDPHDVMSEKTLYPSYAGLGRTAMIWGVPLIPTLFVFAVAVFAALLGAATMGPGGLLFAVPSIPIFLFFKRICETDDQALRILWLEFLCVLDRSLARCFGNTYTLAPMQYGRRLANYKRPFEKSNQSKFVSDFYARAAAQKSERNT
jgi:type IV secretion system protein VirB3